MNFARPRPARVHPAEAEREIGMHRLCILFGHIVHPRWLSCAAICCIAIISSVPPRPANGQIMYAPGAAQSAGPAGTDDISESTRTAGACCGCFRHRHLGGVSLSARATARRSIHISARSNAGYGRFRFRQDDRYERVRTTIFCHMVNIRPVLGRGSVRKVLQKRLSAAGPKVAVIANGHGMRVTWPSPHPWRGCTP